MKVSENTENKEITEQSKAIEADTEKLIFGGVLERDITPFKGITVTMHTLSEEERVKATENLNVKMDENSITLQEASKVPTLIYAITKINNNGEISKFETEESKKVLKHILDKTPAYVIDVLYVEYVKLVSDLVTLLETGVKKN